MENFILKFGKYKGQQFLSTPKNYQDWLVKQDWFKLPINKEARYDIVRKFVKEYAIGMGKQYEIEEYNLSWEVAEEKKNLLNLYQLDDITDYYYINSSIQ